MIDSAVCSGLASAMVACAVLSVPRQFLGKLTTGNIGKMPFFAMFRKPI